MRLAIFTVIISFTAVGCEHGTATDEDFRRGNEIVAGLEKFRGARGHYPDTLGVLAPDFAREVKDPDYGESRWDYIHYYEKDTYALFMWRRNKAGWGYNVPEPKWTYIDNSF